MSSEGAVKPCTELAIRAGEHILAKQRNGDVVVIGLWGQSAGFPSVRLPAQYLREYARALDSMTAPAAEESESA